MGMRKRLAALDAKIKEYSELSKGVVGATRFVARRTQQGRSEKAYADFAKRAVQAAEEFKDSGPELSGVYKEIAATAKKAEAVFAQLSRDISKLKVELAPFTEALEQAQKDSAAGEKAWKDKCRAATRPLWVGDRVSHVKLGDGTVMEVLPDRGGYRVKFDSNPKNPEEPHEATISLYDVSWTVKVLSVAKALEGSSGAVHLPTRDVWTAACRQASVAPPPALNNAVDRVHELQTATRVVASAVDLAVTELKARLVDFKGTVEPGKKAFHSFVNAMLEAIEIFEAKE